MTTQAPIAPTFSQPADENCPSHWFDTFNGDIIDEPLSDDWVGLRCLYSGLEDGEIDPDEFPNAYTTERECFIVADNLPDDRDDYYAGL